MNAYIFDEEFKFQVGTVQSILFGLGPEDIFHWLLKNQQAFTPSFFRIQIVEEPASFYAIFFWLLKNHQMMFIYIKNLNYSMQLVNLMWNDKYLLNYHFSFIGFSDK